MLMEMFLYLFPTLTFIFLLKSLLNFSPTKKKMNNEIFQEDILTEIFSRLPAESVGKFRCLSKTCHQILSSNYFVNLHLSRKTHKESLILTSPFSAYLQVVTLPFDNPTIKELFHISGNVRVVGSCNGLVLLINTLEKYMFLVNPITSEQFKIPCFISDKKKHFDIELLGFGYDSSTEDYKIVVVYHMYSANVFRSSDETLVDLYSVKSGTWKSSSHSLNLFRVCGISCGTFMYGSIHWLVDWRQSPKFSSGILVFNLATEAFYDIDTPSPFFGLEAACSVYVRTGCLFIVNLLWEPNDVNGPYGKIEVWTMEEYGNTNSWTRSGTVIEYARWFWPVPLYSRRDEEILLVTNENTVVVCNLRNETITDVVVDGDLTFCFDGCSFTGSLVSLKGIMSST